MQYHLNGASWKEEVRMNRLFHYGLDFKKKKTKTCEQRDYTNTLKHKPKCILGVS